MFFMGVRRALEMKSFKVNDFVMVNNEKLDSDIDIASRDWAVARKDEVLRITSISEEDDHEIYYVCGNGGIISPGPFYYHELRRPVTEWDS